MRPQHPVLDEPLDIDAGKRVVLQPARMNPHKEMEIPFSMFAAETPVVLADMTAAEESEVVEVVPSVDAPVLDEAVSTLPQETPATTGTEAEVASEPAPEAEADSKPRRKQMTVFQQILVFLLLLVVATFLATIYLYTKGWIELPTAVINVVEKGLSLIQ